MPNKDTRDSVSRTGGRKIVATIIVIATVLAVWKIIDYRMQPPPPPSRAAQMPGASP